MFAAVPQLAPYLTLIWRGYTVQLTSPGWDAIGRSKATADAKASGKVWDGELNMVALLGNPCIRTLANDTLLLVGRGGQGMGL